MMGRFLDGDDGDVGAEALRLQLRVCQLGTYPGVFAVNNCNFQLGWESR